MTNSLNFKKLSPLAVIPKLATVNSAGLDFTSIENKVIMPGHTVVIGTGLACAIPVGFVGMVCPRSGLAAKFSVTVANSPGIIDADYRGELMVIMVNHSSLPFEIKVGDRIAQFVITPVVTNTLAICEVEELDDTERGAGGLGSSGISTVL